MLALELAEYPVEAVGYLHLVVGNERIAVGGQIGWVLIAGAREKFGFLSLDSPFVPLLARYLATSAADTSCHIMK
jgi:hypothetical protein